jgi:hypothetical protein
MSSLPLVLGWPGVDHDGMFAAHCPTEHRTVLLSERRIVGVELGPDTSTITFRCWCGAVGAVTDHRPGHRHLAPRTAA